MALRVSRSFSLTQKSGTVEEIDEFTAECLLFQVTVGLIKETKVYFSNVPFWSSVVDMS